MVSFMLLVLQYVKILTIISALISQWFSGSSSSGFHSSQHPKVALLLPMGLAPYWQQAEANVNMSLIIMKYLL